MKALVKQDRQPGLWLEDVPEPNIGINDVLIEVDPHRHLRHRRAHLQLGRLGPEDDPRADGRRARVRGRDRRGRRNVTDFRPGDIVSGEGHVVCGRCRNCLAGRRHLCARHQGHRRQPARGVCRVHRAADDQRLAPRPSRSTATSQRSSTRLATPSTRPCRFPVLGEDVLITGAGPIGIMAAAVVRHAGARYVVITDVNPYRLELAKTNGGDPGCRRSHGEHRRRPARAGHEEGFDVGLEMSGNPSAFRDMLANMCHGGKIAMLGIPAGEMAIDWNTVVFNMLTIKGIYGREMYETWYKMTVMIQSGLDITPVITHRFHFTRVSKRVRGDDVRPVGQGDFALGLKLCSAVDSIRRQQSHVVITCRNHHDDGMETADEPRFSRPPSPTSSTRFATPACSRPSGSSPRPQHAHIGVSSVTQQVLNLCANNYLGLADHPEVVAAAHEGSTAGATAWPRSASSAARSRSTSELGRQISEFLGTDDTILYSSCFDANGGLFETLLSAEDAIISDELNHASIIDGVRLCKAQRSATGTTTWPTWKRSCRRPPTPGSG